MGVFCLDLSKRCFILLVRFKILLFRETGLLSVQLASSSLIRPFCQPVTPGLFRCTVYDA